MQQQQFSHLANTDCNYHITEQHDQLRVARVPSRPQRQAWQTNMTLGMTITGYLPAFHRILRLPLKMIPMIDIRDICNLIYNARSNKHHTPTSPNAAPATKNDSHDWYPWHMKRHLQCAEQQASPSNLTKCCPCHEKWYASFIVVTYATSFTMREATGISRQHHQILPLPRKMTLMINLPDIWNIIYNARRNRSHPPTSPNAAPATQNDSHHLSSWHMKRHFQCAEQQASPSNLTKYCACHAKWFSGLMSVTHDTSFTMRRATDLILQHHQVLRLPRKMTRIIYPRDIWNVIYNARSNMHHLPTSPNAAPATKNDAHHWLPWHMQRHLQCAEQQASPSNLTKYCACHAKLHSKIKEKFAENSWRVNSNAGTIRTWSDHDPNMIRPWTRHLAPARSPRLLFTLRRRILYWKLQHFALRLSIQISPNTAPATKSDSPTSPNTAPATKNDAHHWLSWHMQRHLQCAEQQASPSNLTKCCACHVKSVSSWALVSYETSFTMRRATDLILQHHQVLRLPRKMTRIIYPRDIWNVIYNARRNMHHLPTSPNAAPATKNDAHHWLPWHMQRHLQCAEQQASPSNLTKYCACHAKLHSKIREKFAENSWRVNSNAGTIRTWSDHDPNMNSSSRTRPFAEVTFHASETHFVLKITTFRAPAIYSNFTEYCACHEKWHSDITKYCTCHEKWHSDITKCCACHEKWHSDITKYCACHEKWHWTVTWLDSYLLFDLNCVFTKLLLDWAVWAVTSLLLLAWAVTWLISYFTAVPWLSCYFTELLLYWTVTSLSCYFTELLLYWAVNLLSCYCTELLLYWAVSLLSCYFTELLLYWAATWLNCYLTELLLYWTVTLLSCYFTELLLYWADTLLSCCFTELLLHF